MSNNFEDEIRITFLDEAKNLLEDVEQSFLNLESSDDKAPIVDRIFRLAHNLKGGANAVGFCHLGEFTHEFESYLLKIKNGQCDVSSNVVDLLLRCKDFIARYSDMLRADPKACLDFSDLVSEMRSGTAAKPKAVETPTGSDITGLHLFDTEAPSPEPKIELVKPKQSQPVSSDEMIRVSLSRVEKLINFVGEMVILQSVLREQVQQTNHLLLKKSVHQLGKVTKEVQDISMSLRMVPLKQTFQKMQRIVRDSSTALGKNVKLTIEGEDTELDKTVLEQLGDPLVHLVRNAVDHGIESPEDRKSKGKSEISNVTLKAFHEAGKLAIEVRDDGVGLDAEKLQNKAREKGILKPGVVLSEQDSYQLIFAPGFSTKAVVTDLSGRGVGMDVVKTNVAQLQGEIEVKTELGKGTCFKIRLPLTMAIIDGMTVIIDHYRYIIPLAHVHESVRAGASDIDSSTPLGEIYCLRGEELPLYRLGHLLGLPVPQKSKEDQIIIVVRTTCNDFAVLVDDIIGQSQIVIKHLGEEHRNQKGFGGSAILGDGRAALILELPELVERYKTIQNSSNANRRKAA